ncbi:MULTISPECIES: YwqG family protein [Exiguobacterium]|uniref:YwqG family protein n=1 Tax=Exiguobacterium TaxID=33986 RepID=UPI001BEA0FC7|nr:MULTISPECIES: YwqG family protein [Exiguobacterium]MCT4783489.1 YwqG family protein [Exiguobacterium himgiriensis]
MELQSVKQWIESRELEHGNEILEAFEKRIHLKLVPRTSREEVAIGYSKFGGYPDLPSPAHHPGENLTFLAQFRLSDFAGCESVEALPKQGLLSFFYDLDEQPWGDAEERHLWRVIYTMETTLERVRIGEALTERAVAFEESYAPIVDTLLELMTEDDFVAMEELFDEGEVHAIGGHPDAVQNDVFEEIEDTYGERFSNPFLLFQMDSTEELDVMFGDVGILYFLIPTEALQAKRFEETEIIMQCY